MDLLKLELITEEAWCATNIGSQILAGISLAFVMVYPVVLVVQGVQENILRLT